MFSYCWYWQLFNFFTWVREDNDGLTFLLEDPKVNAKPRMGPARVLPSSKEASCGLWEVETRV
jgi:hypothetical protein